MLFRKIIDRDLSSIFFQGSDLDPLDINLVLIPVDMSFVLIESKISAKFAEMS